ncbi:MAG: ABC transporter permease [Spirochaetales bacterium]|nr:ABC transporter permease [Spirochaetales bacterium]
MYKWYALRRIVKGIVMFCLLILTYSVLFNTVAENTLKGQIEEQVRMESQSKKNMLPEQLRNFQEERRKQLYSLYRLDKSWTERVIFRAIDTITFRFGKSTIMKTQTGERQVIKIIMEALPRSVLLFSTAAVFEIVLGVWMGLKKAQKPGQPLDRISSTVTMILYGLPTWWLGMMFIMLFVYQFKLFPSGGMYSVPMPEGFIMRLFDLFWHMVLPLATLILIHFWSLAFVVRNIVLSILQEDYIMSARARGIPERKVLFGHTMRTAAPPLITLALLSLLASISGSIIFEGIFSWPGLGNLYWVSIQQNDIPVLLGDLALTTGIYQAGLVILDLTYGFMDPRIKVGGKA